MWKFISRTFERGLRVVRPADEKNVVKRDINSLYTTYCCKKFTPSFLQALAKCKCNNNGPNENKQKSTTDDADSTILGAVSCSSALALGWVLSQPCHWRKWWDRRNEGKYKKPNFIHLLAKVANSQPINGGIHTDTSLSVNRPNNGDSVDGGVVYGPKTAEELLNEAAEEFRAVHDSVTASAENSRGVDYISTKRHREAIALFRSASRRGYAPAAYNLAQCYEMGIGTKQDFSEAAKWYKVAADQGHATAKYNLGVFYAHGLGGLEASNRMARRLFEEAAEKGQPDAKAALSIGNKQHDSTIENFAEEKDWGSSKEDIDEYKMSAINLNEIYKNTLSYQSSNDEIRSPYFIVQLQNKMRGESCFTAGLLKELLCHKKEPEPIYLLNGFAPGVLR